MYFKIQEREKENIMSLRNIKQKKGDSVNPITLETMSFGRTFELKEEKQNVKRKIKKWFKRTMKMRKEEAKDIEDNQNSSNESNKESVFRWVGRVISKMFVIKNFGHNSALFTSNLF